MKNLKKMIAMLLALAMTVALCACGGGGGGGNANSPAPSSGGNDTPAPADDGKVYELIFSMHDAETANSSRFLKEWAAEVEEASNGRIKFIFYFGGAIASAMESMDAVTNGSCDLVWSAPALFPGRFHASLLPSLPMVGLPNNGDGGEIVWNMYEKYDYVRDEWDGMKVLALHANGESVLVTKGTQLTSVDAFKNLRIRTTTPSVLAFLETLGCVPTSFSVTETFENLEKNVADGTIADWNFISAGRFYDVADYATTDVINCALGCLLMNEDSYANLPADLQAIIDEHSGAYASRMASELLGSVTPDIKAECEKNGMTLYAMPEEVYPALEAAKEAGLQAFYDEVAGFGYDGPQMYEDFKAELAAFGY